MIVKVVTCSSAGSPEQYLICYLVNDVVAIDAGNLGLLPVVADQQRVRHVFLSHTHMDHIASLPIFLENVYSPEGPCPTIHASAETLDCLQRDLFNDRLWPDFIGL